MGRVRETGKERERGDKGRQEDKETEAVKKRVAYGGGDYVRSIESTRERVDDGENGCVIDKESNTGGETDRDLYKNDD